MIDVTENEPARQQICRWLEANGVDPRKQWLMPKCSECGR